LHDQAGCGADAVDGATVHGWSESDGAAQLDNEVVELRCPCLLGEQQALLSKGSAWDSWQCGQPVVVVQEHAERVEAEQLSRSG
jgi:hypothetical protein